MDPTVAGALIGFVGAAAVGLLTQHLAAKRERARQQNQFDYDRYLRDLDEVRRTVDETIRTVVKAATLIRNAVDAEPTDVDLDQLGEQARNKARDRARDRARDKARDAMSAAEEAVHILSSRVGSGKLLTAYDDLLGPLRRMYDAAVANDRAGMETEGTQFNRGIEGFIALAHELVSVVSSPE